MRTSNLNYPNSALKVKILAIRKDSNHVATTDDQFGLLKSQ